MSPAQGSNNKSIIMVIVTVVLVVVAVVIAGRTLRSSGGEGDVYFYDLTSGELVAAPAKQKSIVPEGSAGTVRAHVVACGQCTPDTRQIAYLEAQTAAAAEAMAKLKAHEGEPAELAPLIDAGNVVALPPQSPGGEVTWVPRSDLRSGAIISRELTLCPGSAPVTCTP